jgi:NAD(P)-dependent dehydrogenase (short-subunit alcohol dehydrogenase family)
MNPSHIVIAGASGGIGNALAVEAARRWPQATVHAVSRRSLTYEEPNIKTYDFDLTRFEDCEALAKTLSSITPGLQLAIYAIGTLNGTGRRPEKSLNEVDELSLRETFRINVSGAIAFAKALKPHFKHRDPSGLLFLSAKVGSIGDNKSGGWYSYRISKAGLNMAVKNLAFEYQRNGSLAVLAAVHPGTTLTGFSKDYVQHWEKGRVAEPKLTAERLLDLAVALREDQTGRFLHWEGTTIEN